MPYSDRLLCAEIVGGARPERVAHFQSVFRRCESANATKPRLSPARTPRPGRRRLRHPYTHQHLVCLIGAFARGATLHRTPSLFMSCSHPRFLALRLPQLPQQPCSCGGPRPAITLTDISAPSPTLTSRTVLTLSSIPTFTRPTSSASFSELPSTNSTPRKALNTDESAESTFARSRNRRQPPPRCRPTRRFYRTSTTTLKTHVSPALIARPPEADACLLVCDRGTSMG